MKTVKFNVKNNLPTQTTNHVLVFLKPVQPQSDYQYFAWQDLNPSQGYIIPFDFSIDISVAVGDINGGLGSPTSINPGQCFTAINPNGQTPKIDNIDINNVKPEQAGIVNGCNTPDTRIVLVWSNRGNRVITVGKGANDIINVGKIVTFELEPSLYFMAADPTITGPNFTLQDYSDTTEYKLNVGDSEVDVSWTRGTDSGKDEFIFTRKSAIQSVNILDYAHSVQNNLTDFNLTGISVKDWAGNTIFATAPRGKYSKNNGLEQVITEGANVLNSLQEGQRYLVYSNQLPAMGVIYNGQIPQNGYFDLWFVSQ
ncbi:hypothetical protein [Candidatus Nitrosacidococcus tergens]|uniref:Uncharacterized protein n=1 Tax=Candidatus Nitrosacidococcus tergens TaxID=553981 RepID=A0A7G1Q8T7_9GAMM|nr:hypothetical protein [Candidatus Nitrosacidococcus tergens]CAB1275493.1 conserved protein of unknown function [Candidatus Nitrosacidococcus tergens]